MIGRRRRRARGWVAASLLSALLAAAAAESQYLDGRSLIGLCARHEVEDPGLTEAQAVQDLAATGTCRGYLMGIADRLEEEAVAGVCVPATTTLRDLLGVVRGYAARNPGLLDRPASRLVAAALRQAYPCPDAAPAGQTR